MRSRAVVTGVALLACCLFAATAQAGSIKQFFQVDPTGTKVTRVSDESVELLLDADGRELTTIDVGDVIRGIINVSDIGEAAGTLYSVGQPASPEFTAVFQTVVVSKTETFTGSGKYNIVFGPDPNFAEAISLGIAGSATSANGGAMAIFYSDVQDNYESDGNFADDFSKATDGVYFWSLGTTAALGSTGVSSNGEGWIALNTFDSILGLSALDQIGNAIFALNRVYPASAVGLGDSVKLALRKSSPDLGANFVEVTGATNFFVATSATPWPVTDSADFFFNVTSIVPVPAAAWMGFALLGALGLGRRLRRRC